LNDSNFSKSLVNKYDAIQKVISLANLAYTSANKNVSVVSDKVLSVLCKNFMSSDGITVSAVHFIWPLAQSFEFS